MLDDFLLETELEESNGFATFPWLPQAVKNNIAKIRLKSLVHFIRSPPQFYHILLETWSQVILQNKKAGLTSSFSLLLGL